jgi:hypothetical protein
MTLIVDLPEEQAAALTAKARARGVSAEEYVRDRRSGSGFEKQLGPRDRAAPSPGRRS